MSAIKRSIVYSVLVITVLGVGVFMLNKKPQTASAQFDAHSIHDKELEDWQNKVNDWQTQNSTAMQTSLTDKGVTQLPNTGPSD